MEYELWRRQLETSDENDEIADSAKFARLLTRKHAILDQQMVARSSQRREPELDCEKLDDPRKPTS